MAKVLKAEQILDIFKKLYRFFRFLNVFRLEIYLDYLFSKSSIIFLVKSLIRLFDPRYYVNSWDLSHFSLYPKYIDYSKDRFNSEKFQNIIKLFQDRKPENIVKKYMKPILYV